MSNPSENLEQIVRSEDDGQNTKRHPLIRTAEAAAIGYEITPFDDGVRYAILGGIFAATRNPELSAAVYGAVTMVTESAAAVSTADLLASENGEKFIAWTNSKLEKIRISSEARVNKLAKAFLGLYVGSSLLLTLKQREYPDRKLKENVRYGLGTATALSGACALEGYAITDGADVVIKGLDQLKPEVVAPVIIALGGLKVGVKWARGKAKGPQTEDSA